MSFDNIHYNKIEEEQNEKLYILSGTITKLKNQSLVIGETIDRHNDDLDNIAIIVDEDIYQVSKLTSRINKFRNQVTSNLCWIIAFMIIINIILFIIYMKM